MQEFGEHPLTGTVVEYTAYYFKTFVGVALAVAVVEIEQTAEYLCCQWLAVEYHSAFALKVSVSPYIVIAGEVMHLDAHVGQFGNLAKETCVAFRYDIFPLMPEVEHIAKHIYGRCLILDFVEESH